MTVCYFTATGNSLYVVGRIGGKLLSIPQLMRQEKIEIEDNAVGIVCPVYAVELPFMIVDFMKKACVSQIIARYATAACITAPGMQSTCRKKQEQSNSVMRM